MSACLPLWLVKYGGAPVALVAEENRGAAAKAAQAVMLDAVAVGDIVAVAVGTGRPGARGVVAALEGCGAGGSVPASTAADDDPVRYMRTRGHGLAIPQALRAYKAACLAAGMPSDAVTKTQTERACAVRFGAWLALADAGLTFTAVAQVTGHGRSTIAKKVNLLRAAIARGEVPDPHPLFAKAHDAATLSMQHSRASA